MTQIRPIAEVLPGIEIRDLDEGEVPLDAVVLVKIMREDGRIAWCSRHSDNINDMEALGMVTSELAGLLRAALSETEEQNDEDEEDDD